MGSSTRVARSVDGQHFTGILAAAARTSPETSDATSPVDIFNFLGPDAAEVLRKNPALQAERAELVNLAVSLNVRTTNLAKRVSVRVTELRLERHEQLKAQIRAVLQEIEKTKTQIMHLRSEHAQAKNRSEISVGELHAVKQERAALSKYVPAAEIKKADAAVARAETKLAKAQSEEAAPAQAANHLSMVVLRDLSQKWRQLEGEEKDLSLLLSGAEGTNSLGFLVQRRI